MAIQLTVNDLFTPAPSGVGQFGNVPMVPPAGTWLAIMLNIATTVQLPTTAWQPGAPERTILAIEAVTFSQSDADISVMAQGGFLDSAASGTVTYVAVDGSTITVAVTPDPSNPSQNPTGALGWLDLLTDNVYDVQRLSAQPARGPLALVNVTGFSVGPYAAGSYHVGNVATGATYTNQSSLTIPPSAIAGGGGVVTGVSTGVSHTIVTTSAAHGLAVGDVAYLVIPTSSGVTGLTNVFGLVTATTPMTFQVNITSTGTWVSGGTVYHCTQANMVADVAGTSSSAGPGQVTTTVTQNVGVFVSNTVGWSGSNWESNTALAARARLSLAKASPNGPSQAYVYFAETAQQLLANQTPAYILTNGPVTATSYASIATGTVTTVVASETPASTILNANVTPGVAQLAITGVTNAFPCVVSCSGPTSLSAGQSMTVTITGVNTVAGVNGTFIGTYVSSTSFSIPIDTTTGGSYGGGGSVEGGDLGQIDQLLQQNVVPDAVSAITVSAQALPIAVVATVVVPQAFVATYRTAVVSLLQATIAAYPIGGTSPGFAVAYDDIVGALEEAGVLTLGVPSYVRQITSLSLNGGGVGVGVPFPGNTYQAILTAPSISVIGV